MTEPDNNEALLEWKAGLRRDFESWLDEITTLPEHADSPAEEDGSGTGTAGRDDPDLYSLYAELAASNAETKKANRRMAEAFSQWGDSLAHLDTGLTAMRRQLDSRPAAESGLPRQHLLPLVEMVDRLGRLAAAFENPPPARRGWLGSTAAWEAAWSSQREANRMLLSHLLALLQQLGLARIPTLGLPFDPATMAALAAESVPGQTPQTVLEEMASGWTLHGAVLRPAQVRVSR